MVDWDKFFEGLFKGLSAHGVDPVLALAFLALLVAALLVSTMGLALWCALAAIKRLSAPTSASSTAPSDTRVVIEVHGYHDVQSTGLRRVLRQDEERHGDEPRRKQAERGALRHHELRDRGRGAEDLLISRRSFRWNRW